CPRLLTKYLLICFFLPGVKPGDCPKFVLAPYFKPCADKCSNDYDCAFNEKCCLQGCGRTCLLICFCFLPGVKPGDCPNSVPSQFFKPCADQCSSDFDCAFNEKCCLQGCGRMCDVDACVWPSLPSTPPILVSRVSI
uniref:WAP domain-containing protein n=1 Tax=Gouania willdenowi TaxID=441366 RepID=A0A8C5FZQ9_GOUWI